MHEHDRVTARPGPTPAGRSATTFSTLEPSAAGAVMTSAADRWPLGDRRARRLKGATTLMAFVAGTLGVVSGLHLAGAIAGASKSFDPQNAGVAEAVIGAVLAAGTLAVYRQHARARTIGLSALLFAIVGFIVGITITTRGGDAFDIAYHATMLPVLVATAWLLWSLG